MRFAGEVLQDFQATEAGAPGLNPSDLQYTPELPEPTLQQEYQRDNYILRPRSGVAMLPNGEIGPPEGPNTPIKNYGGQFMPDGTQPSGYRPGPTADYPADEMIAGFFNPFDWFNGKNQRDIERIRTGSDEPVEGHGSQGTPLLNNIRKRNQMLDQL